MAMRTRVTMMNLILVGFAMLLREPALAEDAKGVPTASVNENEHRLGLLLPEGKAVEVVGSPSGVTSQSGFLAFIGAQQAKVQLMDEKAGDLGNPPPTSSSPSATEMIEHQEAAGPFRSKATIGSTIA